MIHWGKFISHASCVIPYDILMWNGSLPHLHHPKFLDDRKHLSNSHLHGLNNVVSHCESYLKVLNHFLRNLEWYPLRVSTCFLFASSIHNTRVYIGLFVISNISYISLIEQLCICRYPHHVSLLQCPIFYQQAIYLGLHVVFIYIQTLFELLWIAGYKIYAQTHE